MFITSEAKNIPCKRCRANVVNGVKCIECGNTFHISCARLNNKAEHIVENTFKCCISDEECLNSDDKALCDALADFVDSDSKINIGVVKYILNQKNQIINELKEKINILTDYVTLLKKQNEINHDNVRED